MIAYTKYEHIDSFSAITFFSFFQHTLKSPWKPFANALLQCSHPVAYMFSCIFPAAWTGLSVRNHGQGFLLLF